MMRLLRNVSLRAKITASFVLIVLLGTAVTTLIGSRIITNAMLAQALSQVRQGQIATRVRFQERLEEVRRAVDAAAASERLAHSASGDTERIPADLADLQRKSGLDFLVFVDETRRLAARGSMRRFETYAQPEEPLQSLVRAAAAGRSLVSTEILSERSLSMESPELALRAHLPSSPDPPGGPNPRDAVGHGLTLIAAAPVRSESGLLGVVYGGTLLNRNADFVDRLSQPIFGGDGPEGGAAGSVSVCLGGVRVATTARRDAETRAEGASIADEIAASVVEKGEPWSGRARLLGEWQITAYEPLHNQAGKAVGALLIGMKESPFLAVRTDMMLTFLIVAVAGVLVVLGLTYVITRSMIHPLEEIVDASNRIAAGDLNHTVKVASRDEIGHLAGSFNKMVASLKTMNLELEEWGRTLEEKVKNRTDELVSVQEQMAQSDKLASLGRLAAGVAHEINNPLGGILAFASLALEDCEPDHPLRSNLEVIVKQTLRCRETVKGLLDFARQSSSQASETDINAIVDRTLALFENQSIFQNVRIVRNYGERLPLVLIDPGQLQQVVVNIAINAVDAMEEAGTLTVETGSEERSREVFLRIGDSGPGIPNEILPLIFEPFFTTKQVGRGTGLGLSIVHGIVTRAGGRIDVESTPRGAKFTVRLPVPADTGIAASGGSAAAVL